MKMEYPINFKSLSEKFYKSSDFEVEIITGNAQIEMDELEADIHSVLEELNLDSSEFLLPIAMKEQFCLYNRLWVRWGKPSSPIMGWFHFPHLVEMIESKIEMDGKTLYLFDDFQDMWKVYIELDSINKTHRLYFGNLYEKTYLPMRIDATTYYKKLAMCLGLCDWQEFFMEDVSFESNEGLKEQFEKNFKSMFPEISFNEFKTI